MKWKLGMGALMTSGLIATSAVTVTGTAQAAEGRLVSGSVVSEAIGGPINYTVYLPASYDSDDSTVYPSLYLLHGRGDTQAAWQQEIGDIDELTAAGSIPPMIVIMPDAPWSNAGNYYVDSLYDGAAGGQPQGAAVETAFTTDLLEHIDETFRTVPDRAARAVGGYSMGGAGALRFATAHQGLFSAGIILSPAVYAPTTPVDSSTREFGAYGVGSAIYDEDRYQELNYQRTFSTFDSALPVHLFIAVGDDEYVNPLPEDAIHDLDYEAATLYNQAKRVAGISAELRVYDGGHDWGVWKQGFREGIVDIASRLRTSEPPVFDGLQFGSAGDDRAGGVLGRADGSLIQAINAADTMLGVEGAGGMDILVQKLDSSGAQEWLTSIATALNERAYGVVDGEDGAVIIAGFVRQGHDAGENDDGLVVKLDANGEELWRTTIGSESAPDRLYGVTSDGSGGAFVTGYTSGVVTGPTNEDVVNAGDKDAIVARVSASGSILWSQQFGGSGEDKGLAVSAAADGGVYVGGNAGGAMPGVASAGGYDGWVAKFDGAGVLLWLNSVGSPQNDQVSAVVATSTGVVATGFTQGSLGSPSMGESDVFVTAITDDGSHEWTKQVGSAGDDRGAAIATDAAGQLLVVGHTSGRLGSGPVAGGVDVFGLTLDQAGEIVEQVQFGSAQRDGADEYDEANLFISGGGVANGGSTWVQGVTFGSVSEQRNVGAGDVFLSELPFAALVASGVSSPSDPTVALPIVTIVEFVVSAIALAAAALALAHLDVASWVALSASLMIVGTVAPWAWFLRRPFAG